MSNLSSEQINNYNQDGYIAPINVFSRDEINEINKSVYLKSKQVERGQIKYLFVASKNDVLKNIAESVQNNELLISYQLNL